MTDRQPSEKEPPAGAENYVLGEEIAQGGMGVILEARDRKLSRTVAVKVLLPDSDMDEMMRRRFVREATVLARLEHPNIVPIHDIVWENGMPLFYTMKRVNGRTLHEILESLRRGASGPPQEFTLGRLLIVFRKVCDAVAFAHSRGILHRDLKPENIMVGEFGEVLVMDWGVAKLTRPSSEDGLPDDPESVVVSVQAMDRAFSRSGTLAGAVIGTPHFMSPEQARGEVASHDERSDIFSLGAILYAILTLDPPVSGTTMEEVLDQIAAARITPPTGTRPVEAVHGAKPRPSTVLPHCPGGRVPVALSAVAMKALALDKADRFQSVTELAGDIERYQSGFATRAEHAGLWTEFCLLVRRHKLPAALVGLLLAVSAGFLLKVMASERLALREKEAARQALVLSSLSLAEAELRSGNAPAVRAALEEVPEDLRDATWRYLLGESDTSRPLPDIGLKVIDDIAAHPVLPGVFAAAGEGKIVVFGLRDGRRLVEMPLDFSAPAGQPALELHVGFNATGDRLAVGSGSVGGIQIVDLSTRETIARWPSAQVLELAFDPSGSRLLGTFFVPGEAVMNNGVQEWTPNQTILRLLRTADGREVWQARDGFMYKAKFTEEPSALVAYSWDHQLHLMGSDSGEVIRVADTNFFDEFALQPGGKSFVAGNVLGTIKGYDLDGFRQRFEMQPHGSRISRVAFLPGGERFLTAAWLPDGRQSLQCWDAASGRLCHSLAGGSGAIRLSTIHPVSGEVVVVGRNEAKYWETGSLPPVRTFRSGGLHPSAVFWGSEDVLFAPGRDGTQTSADLQSIATDPPSVLWESLDPSLGQPVVSADGRRAAIGRYDSAGMVQVLERDGSGARKVASVEIPGIFDYVRISPSGDRVAMVVDRSSRLALASADGGQAGPELEADGIVRFNDVAWLKGGSRLVALVTSSSPRSTKGSKEMIVLWDAVTGRRLRSAPCHGISNVLCASPDGLLFAESGADRAVRVRDAESLAVELEFRAHNAPLTAMAWSRARPVLATSGEDLLIRLWDVTNGARIEEIHGPLSPPTVLSFSPSGKRLAAASRDGAARIWEPLSLK